jgi:Tfp pilus assembly protein PilO
VKQRKPTPPLALGGIVLAVVVVFAVAAWFLLVRPKAAEVKDLQAQAKSVQAQIDDLRTRTTSARSAPRIRVADLYRLAKAMPTSTDMPDVLLELNQLADDTGIVFDTITPQQPVPLQNYQALPIDVKFRGNFYDLADLLYRLRTLVDVRGGRLAATGRLFAIDDFSFTQGPNGFPQIQADLTIDAFMYGAAATAAPGSATPTADPASTTATDSTTTDTTAPTGASAAGAP